MKDKNFKTIRNRDGICYELRVGKNFLTKIPDALAGREEMDKSYLIKIKNATKM